MAAPKARLDVWKPKLKNADGTVIEPDRWVTCQTFEDLTSNKRRTNALTTTGIRDVLYEPRTAKLWVANRAQDFKTTYVSTDSGTIAATTYTYIYNDSDGNAAHSGNITLAQNWGLFTNFFYEFQHVRVVDQQTNLVLFTGRIQKIDKRYEDTRGSVVSIDCTDALDELRHIPCKHLQKEVTFTYASGSEWRRSDMIQYALNLGMNFQAANVMTQDANGATKSEASMKTPMRNPLTGTAHNFISDNNASSVATNLYTRYEQSATSLDHDVVWELEKTGNKSLLQEIIRIAVAEPHEAETADDQFGYNFFLDPNYGQYNLDATKGPGVAGWNPPMINYGKRGNRLSTATQYGASGSAANQDPNVWGLKVHMPLVNSVISQGHRGTGGSVETASKVMQRSFDFENPKEELFTGAILTYEARNDNQVDAAGDTDEPASIVRHKEFEICYVNYIERTSSNAAFIYRRKNIDDEWKEDNKDAPGVNSAEYLHAYQDNGSGGAGDLIKANCARVQYQSAVPTGGGSSNTGSSYSYLLLSDISKDFPDATDQGSATHVILKGVTSGNLCRFNAKATEVQEGRPSAVWGMRKIFTRTQMNITRPDELRIEIASRLAQASTQVRRGRFQFSKAPYYWLDCYIRAESTVSGGQEIQVAHTASAASINVTPYGFREGMLIQKMTTDWVAMAKVSQKDVYGYCWEMGSSYTMKVNLTESVDFEVGDLVRLIMPLRAGDIIRVDNALGDVFSDHVLTEINYNEDLGPKTEVESIGNNEVRKGNPHRPKIWSELYGLADLEEQKVATKNSRSNLAANFSGTITYTASGEVSWTAGNLTTSDGKTYQIAAGSTANATHGLDGAMTGTNTYTVSLDPDGENPSSNEYNLKTTIIGDYNKDAAKLDLLEITPGSTSDATPSIEGNQLKKQGDGSSFKVEGVKWIHNESMTSALLKKGARAWVTNLEIRGTAFNAIEWDNGTADTNAALTYSSGDSMYITQDEETGLAATTHFMYLDGVSGTIAPSFTTTYSTAVGDEKILLATITVTSATDGDKPTIFPFNSKRPTLSAVVLAGDLIIGDHIKANTIGTVKFTSDTRTELTKTYVQSAAPTSSSSPVPTEGDIWFDTDEDPVQIKIYEEVEGTLTWLVRNQNTVGGSNIFTADEDAIPASTAAGDIWFATDTEITYYALTHPATTIRTDGTQWTRQDIAKAINTIGATGGTKIDGGVINTQMIILHGGGSQPVLQSGAGVNIQTARIEMNGVKIAGYSSSGSSNNEQFSISSTTGQASFGGGAGVLNRNGLYLQAGSDNANDAPTNDASFLYFRGASVTSSTDFSTSADGANGRYSLTNYLGTLYIFSTGMSDAAKAISPTQNAVFRLGGTLFGWESLMLGDVTNTNNSTHPPQKLLLDGGALKFGPPGSEVALSFSSHTHVADITAVIGGQGLTGNITSGDATINMGTPGTLNSSTENATTTLSHTHEVQGLGGGGEANENSFKYIARQGTGSGSTPITAQNATDTINFVGGTDMSIAFGGTSSNPTITFNATGGGGGGSGTVNTGAANRGAYYASAGTTLDDTSYFMSSLQVGSTSSRVYMTACTRFSASSDVELTGLSVASGTYLKLDSNNDVVLSSSSRKYKENIENLTFDTSPVYDLVTRTFKYKDYTRTLHGEEDDPEPEETITVTGKNSFGFIAEEVNEILPDLVLKNNDGEPEDVEYQLVSILLLEEMKKLKTRIEVLEGNG